MKITTLQAKQVKKMIDNYEFDLIIDLRTEDNYLKGHIPGAINIPINEITDKVEFLNEYKDKHVILYCGIGSQSKSACKVLALNGFDKLYNLANGMKTYTYDLEL